MKTAGIIITVCLCIAALGCAAKQEDESPSVSFNARAGNYGPGGAEIGIGTGFGTPPDGMPPMNGEKPSFDGKRPGPPPGGFKGRPEDAGTVLARIKGVCEINGSTVSETGKTYAATQPDQSAIVVKENGELTIEQASISKKGKSANEETSSLYGINAAVMAVGKSYISIAKSSLTTDAAGANAVVAVGEGSSVSIDGLDIKTTDNSSRGLHATRQGRITARNVSISTLGAHSAAVATDRGGGTVTVYGGTLKTAGDGSPSIYSTGNISVNSVTGESTGAECAVIEGKNTVTANDSNLTCYKRSGVMLYQSFSGDAEVGGSTFTMNGGSITSFSGPVFYTTNTRADFLIARTKIINKDASGVLFKASADRWGKTGSNGSVAQFTLIDTEAKGKILCDNISIVKTILKDKAVFTGAVNPDKTAKLISLSMESGTRWNLTADSYLSEFSNADTTLANIRSNGFNIYYDGNSIINQWTKGKEIALPGGGKLIPVF